MCWRLGFSLIADLSQFTFLYAIFEKFYEDLLPTLFSTRGTAGTHDLWPRVHLTGRDITAFWTAASHHPLHHSLGRGHLLPTFCSSCTSKLVTVSVVVPCGFSWGMLSSYILLATGARALQLGMEHSGSDADINVDAFTSCTSPCWLILSVYQAGQEHFFSTCFTTFLSFRPGIIPCNTQLQLCPLLWSGLWVVSW